MIVDAIYTGDPTLCYLQSRLDAALNLRAILRRDREVLLRALDDSMAAAESDIRLWQARLDSAYASGAADPPVARDAPVATGATVATAPAADDDQTIDLPPPEAAVDRRTRLRVIRNSEAADTSDWPVLGDVPDLDLAGFIATPLPAPDPNPPDSA